MVRHVTKMLIKLLTINFILTFRRIERILKFFGQKFNILRNPTYSALLPIHINNLVHIYTFSMNWMQCTMIKCESQTNF